MKTMKPFLAVLVFLLAAGLAGAADSTQIYQPTNWVNNPFNPNPNFAVLDAGTASPVYTNTGDHLGTLYGHAPIGATLPLTRPGDSITLACEVTLDGALNPRGNVQFRMGLFQRGDSTNDVNWLGYMIGNPTASVSRDVLGFYIRNNPNPGIYASGSPGNAMLPKCELCDKTGDWSAGVYDCKLSVTQLSDKAQVVTWKLAAKAPGNYHFSGAYTNTFTLTAPPAFDHVGFLGGAALFESAANHNRIAFKDVTVSYTKGVVQ